MRALVVGLGRMGRFHARVLTDLGFDVATVDPNPAAGAQYAQTPAMLTDVVCIAVPLERLAEQAEAYCDYSGRLFVEKPFAATARDASDLEALLRGQRACVGYVERFNPRVRDLKALLAGMEPQHAVFRRWNDRPSANPRLDLMSHDIDLARYLDLDCPCIFDAQGDQPVKRRDIDVDGLHVNLLDHATSPLHAQWRAFLTDEEGFATPADAVAVLDMLEAFDAEVTA